MVEDAAEEAIADDAADETAEVARVGDAEERCAMVSDSSWVAMEWSGMGVYECERPREEG